MIIIHCVNIKEASLFLSSIYFNSFNKNEIIVPYRKIGYKIYLLTIKLGKGCQNKLWYLKNSGS